jgi:tetratricopeptide (TPR) repeat protein
MSAERDRGLAALRRQDYDAALPLLEQACYNSPNDFYAHQVLGGLYYELKRDKDAVRMLLRAVQLAPDSAQARYNLGIALERLGRTADAITALESAIHLEPDYEQAKQVLKRWQEKLAASGEQPACTPPEDLNDDEDVPEEQPQQQQEPEPVTALVTQSADDELQPINLPAPTRKPRRTARKAGTQTAPDVQGRYHFEPVACREAQQALNLSVLSLIPVAGVVLGPYAFARALAARRLISSSRYLTGSSLVITAATLTVVSTFLSVVEIVKWVFPLIFGVS